VAGEVRRLAERSQTAAKQISALAGKSVQVAERSGALLEAMVPSIRRTATLTQDVALSSVNQATAIAQVGAAMSRVDEVTQHNAAVSEELAGTAEELSAQAEALQSLMTFFQLDAAQAAPPRAKRSLLKGIARPARQRTKKPAEDADFQRFTAPRDV